MELIGYTPSNVRRLKEAWVGVTKGLSAEARRRDIHPLSLDLHGNYFFGETEYRYDVRGHFADPVTDNPVVMMANLLNDNVIHARSGVLLTWRGDTPKVLDYSITVNEDLGITIESFIPFLNYVGMFAEQSAELL